MINEKGAYDFLYFSIRFNKHQNIHSTYLKYILICGIIIYICVYVLSFLCTHSFVLFNFIKVSFVICYLLWIAYLLWNCYWSLYPFSCSFLKHSVIKSKLKFISIRLVHYWKCTNQGEKNPLERSVIITSSHRITRFQSIFNGIFFPKQITNTKLSLWAPDVLSNKKHL